MLAKQDHQERSERKTRSVRIPLSRIPLRRKLSRRFDVGREIDFAPLLTVDVERPNVAVLREVVDDAEVPDRRALAGAHGALDRVAKALGAAASEGEQADGLRVDAFADPFADGAQTAGAVF